MVLTDKYNLKSCKQKRYWHIKYYPFISCSSLTRVSDIKIAFQYSKVKLKTNTKFMSVTFSIVFVLLFHLAVWPQRCLEILTRSKN